MTVNRSSGACSVTCLFNLPIALDMRCK